MESEVIQLDDGRGHQLLAVQSPNGNVIVTVATSNWSRIARIELDARQIEELSDFLAGMAVSQTATAAPRP